MIFNYLGLNMISEMSYIVFPVLQILFEIFFSIVIFSLCMFCSVILPVWYVIHSLQNPQTISGGALYSALKWLLYGSHKASHTLATIQANCAGEG